LGKEVPAERLIWQDNVPQQDATLAPTSAKITEVKALIRSSGLTTAQLVETAWASASTYRQTDHRGGANGARIRLAPQKDWPVNKPAQLTKVISVLEGIASLSGVSVADMIVLGGCVGVEDAISRAGLDVEVPFTAGRTDATQDETEIESFKWLEPKTDGFRNFSSKNPLQGDSSPEESLLDRAHLLSLTAPEMTVLVAGLRTLTASTLGQFTDSPGVLNNAWFQNLLSMDYEWKASEGDCML